MCYVGILKDVDVPQAKRVGVLPDSANIAGIVFVFLLGRLLTKPSNEAL
jgi:hypothetical protein